MCKKKVEARAQSPAQPHAAGLAQSNHGNLIADGDFEDWPAIPPFRRNRRSIP
jgi:hypothetical protein